jgi:hypothetical protein
MFFIKIHAELYMILLKPMCLVHISFDISWIFFDESLLLIRKNEQLFSVLVGN